MSSNSFIHRFKQRLYLWYRNYCSRRQLLSLSRQQLKDIGLSRADAVNEATKPFWRE